MYVVVLILKSEAYARPVVSTLIELELFDSTVLDGEGVENVAGETMPILSEVSALFGKDILFNKTIITVVPDQETIFSLNAALKRDGIDLTQPEVGTLVAFPCPIYIGAEYGS
jgi:hypothetical protein